MPEGWRFAFAVTLSLDKDLTQEVMDMFLRLCKKAKYYAVVFERAGDTRRLHAHAAVIYDHGRKASNVKSGTFMNGVIKDAICAQRSANYGLCVSSMYSDDFIVNYLQKDGDIYDHNLPDDFQELRHYFPDTATVKELSPDYAKWERMYHADGRPLPADEEDVEEFFGHHINIERDLQKCGNARTLKDRYKYFAMYINKESVPDLVSRKRKRDAPFLEFLSTRLDEDDLRFVTASWLQE